MFECYRPKELSLWTKFKLFLCTKEYTGEIGDDKALVWKRLGPRLFLIGEIEQRKITRSIRAEKAVKGFRR